MSRMLKVLQELESRQQGDRAPAAVVVRTDEPPAAPVPAAVPAPEGLLLVDSLLQRVDSELQGGGESAALSSPAILPLPQSSLVNLEGAGAGQEVIGVYCPLDNGPAIPSSNEETGLAPTTAEMLWRPSSDGSSLATASSPQEAAAKEPDLGIARQYHELAAAMVEAWDLPVAVALVGATAARSHAAIALPLAAAIRQLLQVEVLLVDADFCEPASAGCGQLGQLQLVAAADCRKLAVPTIFPGVHRLAARDDRPGAELMQMADFGSWLAACRESYPVVMVVAPPWTCRETLPLAAAADGVYLVVRLGYVPQRVLRHLTATLRAAGGQVIGCVALGEA